MVYAAGALQDGARDRLDAVHDRAIRALLAAAAARGVGRFVQVSTAGVGPEAETEFFRSKARGDAAMRQSGLGWLVLSLGLHVLAGACWLPVLWIQLLLRDLAAEAARTGTPLPQRYHWLYRIWFALGGPAFAAVLAILWLMIARPVL